MIIVTGVSPLDCVSALACGRTGQGGAMRVIYWDWDRRILGVNSLPLVTQTHPGDLVTLVICGGHRAENCAACPRVINFATNLFVQWISMFIHHRRSTLLYAGTWCKLLQWRLFLGKWSVQVRCSARNHFVVISMKSG